MARFDGQVAIVTGAASPRGIGYATARKLLRQGATVVMVDIAAEELQQSAESLEAEAGVVMAMPLDVGNTQQWQGVIDKTLADCGRLDILVNNAGCAMMRPITDSDDDDFDAMVSVNLRGVFTGCRLGVAAMRKTGGGVIVNVSSIAGIVGVNGMSLYSATKGAVRLFSKALSLELAKENIRCNSVHPGMIDTNFFHETALDAPDAAAMIASAIPMGKLGQPDDIANCIAFLASGEAAYITGTEIIIDGGYSAQ